MILLEGFLVTPIVSLTFFSAIVRVLTFYLMWSNHTLHVVLTVLLEDISKLNDQNKEEIVLLTLCLVCIFTQKSL